MGLRPVPAAMIVRLPGAVDAFGYKASSCSGGVFYDWRGFAGRRANHDVAMRVEVT